MPPRMRWCRGFVLLLIPILAHCGSAGEEGFSHPLLVAANEYGPQAPDGAHEVSPQELAAQLDSGAWRLVSARSLQADLDQVVPEEAAARLAAQALYAQNPEFLSRFDQPLPQGSPYVIARPDGTVGFRGTKADEQTGQVERWFVAEGKRAIFQELVDGRLLRERADNEHGIYALMYDLLPTQFITDNALPDPASVANESLEFLRGLNGKVAGQFREVIDDPGVMPPPPGYPASWTDEEGAEYLSDRYYTEDVLPTGLWSTVDFPLKWCATRVRNQGPTRGTSSAFAITGAVEARFAALRSRWLNLSEQMLYNQALAVWQPRDFGDGMQPGIMLRHMRTYAFAFPFESSWDYNRSPYRQELAAPPRYSRSCWLNGAGARHFGEYCSDTTHQSPIHCANLNGHIICGADNPVLFVPRAPGVRIGAYRVVWSMFERHPWLEDPDTGERFPASLATADVLLDLKVPLVLFCELTEDFATATENRGVFYWTWATSATAVGAHAMLVVGHVRGYFVCKNSWGTDWGDGGYCYVPEGWMYDHAMFLYAVVGVAD